MIMIIMYSNHNTTNDNDSDNISDTADCAAASWGLLVQLPRLNPRGRGLARRDLCGW